MEREKQLMRSETTIFRIAETPSPVSHPIACDIDHCSHGRVRRLITVYSDAVLFILLSTPLAQ
jgi:hypothetical protein